eukprot:m.333720 g.333720  ORF g.333720 m.333720 type:complete len:173 (+) comp17208_c0_seq1:72-590(+)
MALMRLSGGARAAIPLRSGLRCVCLSTTVRTESNSKWVGLIDDQDFFKKNEQHKRPMSPHLTIYRPQLTSMLSITHRGTGVALTGAISIAGITLGFGPEPLSFYLDFLQTLPAPLIFTGKFLLAWPFTYHTANGVRHLAWDGLYGFDLGSLYKSGWFVLSLSIVSAGGIACL